MRKIVTGGIAVALGVSTIVASGAFASNPDSNGAQRSGITTATDDGNDHCHTANGADHGFAIFNAPGKPGATIKFNGEVSLKRGAINTLYNVYLVPDGGNCMTPTTMLMTNNVGNGNAHLARPGTGAGTYYIVLQDQMGHEQFASGAVTVK